MCGEMNSPKDLGCVANIDVIQQYVSLQDKFLIDAGCGDMIIAKMLAENGARVLAIDPDPVQAKKNREAAPMPGIEFVESGADRIPAADQTVDGVFFSYSLHHIPAKIYPEVFVEVLRVLKPDGFVYVIEPTDCPLNQIMMQFHDEEMERAVAQNALQEFGERHFESMELLDYHSARKFESFEDFARHFSSRSFNSLYSEADVRAPAVQEAFERHGAPDYSFTAPKRVVILKNVRADSPG